MFVLLFAVFFSTSRKSTYGLQEQFTLDEEPIYKRTFHVATTYNIAGRISFKPWLSFDDAAADSSSVKIKPNFDDGSFDVQLIPSFAQDRPALNCILQLESLDASEDFASNNNLTSDTCAWSRLMLKPGHWYKFYIYQSEGKIGSFWQPVEPAFEPDLLGITVVPFENSIEVRTEQRKVDELWKPLIGEGGEILLDLLGTEKSAVIEVRQSSPVVQFNNLDTGSCYTLEAMSSVDNILSFNRSWFHVRTSAPSFDLTLLNVSSNSALVRLTKHNTNFKIDPSCSTILSVNSPQLNWRRFYFLNDQLEGLIEGLKPKTAYTVTGTTQCGRLEDLCRLQKTALGELQFETTD